MDYFIEPRVNLKDKDEFELFKDFVNKMHVKGYAILGQKVNKKEIEKKPSRKYPIEISRIELDADKLSIIKKQLASKRHACEILSINTSNEKIAQWVVKDNRVDILTIPIQNMNKIITKELANVASANRTFFELEISPFLIDDFNNSISIRTLYKIAHLLIKRKAPIILTANVSQPFLIRDARTITAFGEMIGIPSDYLKNCFQEFYDRVLLNRKKLQNNFVAPGIWKVKDKRDTEKENTPNIKEIKNDLLPFNVNNLIINEPKLERQRYLLFKIFAEKNQSITKKDLEGLIWSKFKELFGLIMSSRVGLYLTHFDEKDMIGIIRCNHRYLKLTRVALGTISEFQNRKLFVNISKISGTIKNLKQKTRNHNKN